jgi:hypothetical protein
MTKIGPAFARLREHMTHHPSQHDEHSHKHHPPHHRKGLHKHWLTWVVVGLMLAAMVAYVLSDNESIRPGGGPQGQAMPAAPAAP